MSLVQMSAAGGVMILAIIVLRALLMNRLPKRAFVWLWLVALIRLSLPFSIPFKLSVYTAASRAPAGAQVPEPVRQFAATALPVTRGNMQPLPEPAPRVWQGTAASGPSAAPISIDWWLVIYIAGALAVAIYLVMAYIGLKRVLGHSRALNEGFACAFIRDQKLRRRVGAYASDAIQSPVTFGLLHPRVLLPEAMLPDEHRLRYVLTHEFVHIRRFDAPTKLLFALCLCAHWFNPLVWVMYVLYNRDVELSCDERVLRLLGLSARKDYARLLLSTQQGGALMPLANSFSRYSLKERIVAIMKYKNTSALASALALVMVILVAGAFATSAEPVEGTPVQPGETVSSAFEGVLVKPGETVSFNQINQISETGFYNPELPLSQRALALMTADYQDMSVAAFERAVRSAFPDQDPPLFESTAWYNHHWDDPVQYRFLTGPYQNAVMDIYYEDGDPRLHPGQKQGTICAHDIDHVELPAADKRPFAKVFYWITCQIPDREAVSVGERERLLDEYRRAMDDYIRTLSYEQLFELDPIPGLRAERDRIAKRLSSERMQMRAVDIGWWFNYDNTSYSSPRNFFDNLEVPPIQHWWQHCMILEPVLTDAQSGMSYGVDSETGEGGVSPCGGFMWYHNGYRDPVSGVSFRYLPETEQAQISPDNGGTWWTLKDGDYFSEEYPALAIYCDGPDEWSFVSSNPSDWDLPQAPYEG